MEELEKFEAEYPHIDFESLTDLSKIKAHAEAIDLFAKALPEGIKKSSSFGWYQALGGAYHLILPKTTERLEVFPDATGKWTARGSINRNQYTRGGFAKAEDAIKFTDGLLPIFGNGMIHTLPAKEVWRRTRNRLPTECDQEPLQNTRAGLEVQNG